MPKRRAKGTGTYYKRDDGLWVAQFPLPNGKRKVKYSRKQKDVIDWLHEMRLQGASGTYTDDNKVTFGDFLDKWFEEIKAPTVKLSTYFTHESIIRNHIKPEIGNVRLSEITPALLSTLYAKKLKSGLSKRTVAFIHTIIQQTLKQAHKWGLVPRNVAEVVDAPTPEQKPVEPLSRSQVNVLLNHLKEDRLFALYVVMLGCGLRRGEALALQWDCVNFDSGFILVKRSLQNIPGRGIVVSEPKSRSSYRIIAMPEFVRYSLQRHKDMQIVESEYVFCTSKGTPFSPRNVVKYFKKALREAGLPTTIRIHDLRHTFVSYMLSQNVPPKDVQMIAGHADFSTTMDIYGHLMPGAQKKAAEKMDKLFDTH